MKFLALASCVLASSASAAAPESMDFSTYLSTYSVSIPESELALRKSIFEQNLKTIKHHNSQNQWKMGVTQFAHLTPKEFTTNVARGYNKHAGRSGLKEALGAEPAPVDSHVSVEELPATKDWRTVPGVLSPVKNQESCGSCWAFAATETAESHLAVQFGKSLVLSPQQLVDCAPNPDHCGGTGGCLGSTAELAYNYTKVAGLVSEEEYPYTAKTDTCKVSATSPKRVATIDGYVSVPNNNVTALMNAVQIEPVAICVAASAWGLYSGGIFDSKECGTDVNHVVQLVGYGSENNEDYWIVRNSWGPSWGEDGFIRIKRFSDDETPCALDNEPLDGVMCKGQTEPIKVCGLCGMLSDSCYPTGGSVV